MKIFITPTRKFHTTPPSLRDGVPPLRGGLTKKHRKTTQILISYPPPNSLYSFCKNISQTIFENPIQKDKSKPFSFWFPFCIHIYFSIFSPVGMRIFLKSFEKPNQIFHTTPPSRSDGVPPLRGGLTKKHRIKHRIKHRKTIQILISYPPPQILCIHFAKLV